MNILDGKPLVSVSMQKKKKFLGIYFACCNVYGRIYNHSGTHYEGKCPKCIRSLKIRIGNGGVNDRFFIASWFRQFKRLGLFRLFKLRLLCYIFPGLCLRYSWNNCTFFTSNSVDIPVTNHFSVFKIQFHLNFKFFSITKSSTWHY